MPTINIAQEDSQMNLYAAVVSADKMNVLYVGLDNPISVAVIGLTSDKVKVSINNGTIKSGKLEHLYLIKPSKPGKLTVLVMAELKGEWSLVDEVYFRVKLIPAPVCNLPNQNTGSITKEKLVAIGRLYAMIPGFDYSLDMKILSYSCATMHNEDYSEVKVLGNKFTPELIDLIMSTTSGAKIYFENIKATMPDGTVRNLNSVIYKIK